MPKFFFALEKKTLEAYRDSRREIGEAAAKMSSTEIAEWKAELVKTANVRALPDEVDSANFQAPALYSVDAEGTANIEVSGILLNYVDWYDLYYSDEDPITTYGFIREAALRADEDFTVSKIRFNANTPGGIVDSVDLTSQVIANLSKPTETIGFGQISSAGIWLFSQTDKIISSDPTVFYGSIGVAVTYINLAKMYEEMGVEIIHFTNDASQDKRPDLSTDHGKQIIIKELNDLFGIFIQRVAIGRKVTVDFAKKNFGKGGVLIAADAEKVGLIDQVELQTINKQVSEPDQNSDKPRSSASIEKSKKENTMDPKTMTLIEFLAQNSAAKAEHEKALETAKAKGKSEGIADKQAEIDRIHPLISAEGASKALIESGFKALKGESSVDSFVAIADYETRVNEKAKADAADSEKEGDINPDAKKASTDGKIRTQEDVEAEKALFAKMKGKEEEAA